MSDETLESSQWTTRQTRNSRTVALWTAAWLVTLALANFGPTFFWDHAAPVSILSVALNLAVGVGMILANRRLIMDLDEMQRQVQVQAMAFALGIGLVVGLAYSTLDVVNLIPFDAEISHLVMLVALVFLVSVKLGLRKLR